MELPEELLLVICEHLQPARYEDGAAALPDDYYGRRRAAHRPAAAVKMVSRGLQSLMTRTARVVRASDYRSWAEFAAQTHRHAELFEGDAPWVRDEVLSSLHKVMPRLRAVDLSIVTRLLAPRTLRTRAGNVPRHQRRVDRPPNVLDLPQRRAHHLLPRAPGRLAHLRSGSLPPRRPRRPRRRHGSSAFGRSSLGSPDDH